MAIVHFINQPKSQTKAGMLFVLRYTMSDKKTMFEGQKLVSGINCIPQSAYTEFNNTKLLYGKDGGRMYYHFTQSFPVGEDISPQLAHEIALKFIRETEKFKGFEVVVSTHCDRNHIHSHFVMNSVNADDGSKFHISQRDVEQLMEVSDRLIEPYGLSICVPNQATQVKKSVSNSEYYTLKKQESWKLQLAITVDDCMKIAKSKRHFKWLMEQEGYRVKWTDERKYITYTTPDGKLCRDIRLHEEKYLKGNMENEFRIRTGILWGFQKSGNEAAAFRQAGRADRQPDRTELEFAAHLSQQAATDAGEGLGAAGYADDRGGYGPSSAFAEERIRGAAPEIGRNFHVDERGDEGILETGWEVERAEFIESLTAERTNEAFYKTAISDWADSGHSLSGVGTDLLYLAADLSRIVDDGTPIQDSTTIRYKPERKRQNQGPKMTM